MIYVSFKNIYRDELFISVTSAFHFIWHDEASLVKPKDVTRLEVADLLVDRLVGAAVRGRE